MHFCALINFYGCAMNGRFSFATTFHIFISPPKELGSAHNTHSHTSFWAFCTSKKRWQNFSHTKLDSPKGFREKRRREKQSYGRAIYYYFLLLAFMLGWCGLKMAMHHHFSELAVSEIGLWTWWFSWEKASRRSNDFRGGFFSNSIWTRFYRKRSF